MQGNTTGFEFTLKDGTTCVIMTELVGCIGDTLGLNTVNATLGHNSTFPCHLCRYHNIPETFPGSRYAKSVRIS